MGKRVFVAAGHSRVAPGLVTPEFREFDVNYEALQIFVKRFQHAGFEVFVPDESIYQLPYPQYLTRRIEMVNDLHAQAPLDLAIDIHHNFSPSPRTNGIWLIYGSQRVGQLAEQMESFLKELNHTVRAMSLSELGRSLGFIKRTTPPALIVECGFLTGAVDKLIIRFARGLLYNAIADAVIHVL